MIKTSRNEVGGEWRCPGSWAPDQWQKSDSQPWPGELNGQAVAESWSFCGSSVKKVTEARLGCKWGQDWRWQLAERDGIPGGIATAASTAKRSQRVLGTAGLVPQVDILGKVLT